ncbi:MAG: flagellar hook-length control protein FliK [Deltaproteobacteria bacterium]|jgi:hypothetical protein|nr:flagellar hook-length control protein FliK [Deltaproteobacteria bacterium]
MPTTMTISALRIEQTETTFPRESFEAGYDGDFERVLEHSRQNREAIAEDLDRGRERLVAARRELEEGLRSRREDVRAELRKASRAAREGLEGLEEEARASEEADRAAAFGADRVSRRTARASLVVAGSVLPMGFKRQVGAGLMASGKEENALNGYLLTGGGRPTGFLKGTLEQLGSLGQSWKLDREALPELEALFLESGVAPEDAAALIGGLSGQELTLQNVLRGVSKADDLARTAEGAVREAILTATPGGLTNLGQFLSSLGLSTEAVKAATSLAPGQAFTSFDLRSLLTGGGSDDVLAPLLADGDLASLSEALRSMGGGEDVLGRLQTLLSMSQGQASLDDFLGLLAFSEQPGPADDPARIVAGVQDLLSRTSTDSELVKAPIFNEIMLRMTLLGDRELSDEFLDLSPALQALRGGLSGWREGQGGEAGQGGGQQQRGREREERLLAMDGLRSQTLGRGLSGSLFDSSLSQEAAGYSGETLARQIGQKLIYSARRGVHRLKMNLDPESLGRLDVELKVKGDKLTAHIRAESLEAYEALEREMSALKESLGQAGLELAMTLSYDGQGLDGQARGQAMARFGHEGGGRRQQAAGPGEGPGGQDDPGPQMADGRLLDKIV